MHKEGLKGVFKKENQGVYRWGSDSKSDKVDFVLPNISHVTLGNIRHKGRRVVYDKVRELDSCRRMTSNYICTLISFRNIVVLTLSVCRSDDGLIGHKKESSVFFRQNLVKD